MAKKKKESKAETRTPIGIVRIRGEVKVEPTIKDTLEFLRLHKKNRCVIILADKSYVGMISKVKDFCTFGEVDEETVAKLLQKRGRIVGNKPLTVEYMKKEAKVDFKGFAKAFMAGKMALKDINGIKPFFKLHPPIGGFEREGIKKPYSIGGALGYRGKQINKLIRRML